MLEGGGTGHPCGCFQFFDQLPGVQRIHKVNISGATVEYFNGQIAVIVHAQGSGFLVGVAAVFQFKFFHVYSPFLCCAGNRKVGARE